VTQFGGVLTVVAANAYDLRRPHRREKCSLRQRDWVRSARGQTFRVSFRGLGSGDENAGDVVPAGQRLNQAVLRLALQKKSAILHNHENRRVR
jgi:hypothetical protein